MSEVETSELDGRVSKLTDYFQMKRGRKGEGKKEGGAGEEKRKEVNEEERTSERRRWLKDYYKRTNCERRRWLKDYYKRTNFGNDATEEEFEEYKKMMREEKEHLERSRERRRQRKRERGEKVEEEENFLLTEAALRGMISAVGQGLEGQPRGAI